jgi:hypothetical protein
MFFNKCLAKEVSNASKDSSSDAPEYLVLDMLRVLLKDILIPFPESFSNTKEFHY